MTKVYSGRNLLPAKHTDLKVRVLNASNRPQALTSGTKLGTVAVVSVEEEAGSETAQATDHPTSAAETTVTEGPVGQSVKVEEPAERILKELPADLSRRQRKRVAELVRKHDGIFSKHEFDIGRIQYEYRIAPVIIDRSANLYADIRSNTYRQLTNRLRTCSSMGS